MIREVFEEFLLAWPRMGFIALGIYAFLALAFTAVTA